MSRPPKRLAEMLLDRVFASTGRRVRGLSVEVAGETIVLRGEADSFHVKQLALSGVREILPVARVENAIAVTPSLRPGA